MQISRSSKSLQATLKLIALSLLLPAASPVLADEATIAAELARFDTFLQQQQGQQALDVFTQLQRQFPSHPLVGVTQARIMLMQNNVQGGVNLLNTILREHPDHPEATIWLADVESKTGNLPTAVRRATTASDAYPEHVGLAEFAAQLFHAQNDVAGSLPYMQRAADSPQQNDEQRAARLANLGMAYANLQRHAEAAQALNRSWNTHFVDAAFLEEARQHRLAGSPERGLALLQMIFNLQQAPGWQPLREGIADFWQEIYRAFAGTDLPAPQLTEPANSARVQALNAALADLRRQVNSATRLQLARSQQVADEGLTGIWFNVAGGPMPLSGEALATEWAIARAALVFAEAGHITAAVESAEWLLLPQVKLTAYATMTPLVHERGGADRSAPWISYLREQHRRLPFPDDMKPQASQPDVVTSDSSFGSVFLPDQFMFEMGLLGAFAFDSDEFDRELWHVYARDEIAKALLETDTPLEQVGDFVRRMAGTLAGMPADPEAVLGNLLFEHALKQKNTDAALNAKPGFTNDELRDLAALFRANGQTEQADRLLALMTRVDVEAIAGASEAQNITDANQRYIFAAEVYLNAGNTAAVAELLERAAPLIELDRGISGYRPARQYYALLLAATGQSDAARALAENLQGYDLDVVTQAVITGAIWYHLNAGNLDAALNVATGDDVGGVTLYSTGQLLNALMAEGNYTGAEQLVHKITAYFENDASNSQTAQLSLANAMIVAGTTSDPVFDRLMAALIEKASASEALERSDRIYQLSILAARANNPSLQSRVQALVSGDQDRLLMTLGMVTGHLRALGLAEPDKPNTSILETRLVMI